LKEENERLARENAELRGLGSVGEEGYNHG
jgi:hypothetical protein